MRAGADKAGAPVSAAGATAVDEADAAHVTIGHLVPAKVDRMVRAQFAVDLLVRLAITAAHVGITAVAFRQLLLDDVRPDRFPEGVLLTGENGGNVVQSFVLSVSPDATVSQQTR